MLEEKKIITEVIR